MGISGADCRHVLYGGVSEVRRLILKNGLRKERKMTTIIFGILGLLGGLALAVCLGLVLYKDKSEDPVAHSKGLILLGG
jgi:hypothetical protein